jgi:xylulokinase
MLLGLDVGTTATKALLFDPEGNVRASARASYGLITPQPGWVEQDPEELWRAVVTVLRSIVSQLQPEQQVLALAQSSQGGTTVPVDAAGQPTYNAISWMDGRAQAEYDDLSRQFGGEVISEKTGWPLMAGLPLQHIRWLRTQQPDTFARSRHFLFVNDFIGRRLTGELCMNPSDASITQLLDIETGDWDDWLLMLDGIRREQLSPVHPSGVAFGKLTAEASSATGLPAGLPVINGAHDQYCAAVGMRVARPGSVLLSCGTAWVLLAVPEDLDVGRRSGMALSCHAVPGRWGAIRSLGAVGTSLDWLIDHTWAGHEGATHEDRSALYQAVNAAAGRSGPGAHGLIFCPLAGGHAGSFGVAQGGFLGLTLTHGRGDLSRAVMEGVACELRWALDEIQAAGVTVHELTMVGGAARSPLWPQIVADVTGVGASVPAITEAASWGAAVLAGIGVGVFEGVESAGSTLAARSQHFEPGNRAVYEPLYERYRLLWPSMSGQAEVSPVSRAHKS